MPIRLVVADAEPIVLYGLETLFRVERDFKVAACCQTGIDTLAAVRRHRPDILVLDIRMPQKDGLEVLRELRQDGIATRAVLFAAELDEHEALEALRLGIRGMVLKEQELRHLIQCVRKVHAGEQWLEKQASGRALDTLLGRESGRRGLKSMLTPRELEMVRMVANGLRNKEMSDRLGIALGTVKIHLHNIYQKLKVESRVTLLLQAQSRKLI